MSMADERLEIRLQKRDFEELAKMAMKEHLRFTSDSDSARKYDNKLAIIALSQGSATYYVYPEATAIGIKDLDVLLLYRCDSLWLPSWRRIKGDEYKPAAASKSVKVDFSKGAIQKDICESYTEEEGLLQAYLDQARSAKARHIGKQCVIGLWPERLSGVILHKPALKDIMEYRTNERGKPS